MFACLLMAVLSIGQVWAAEELKATIDFSSNDFGVSTTKITAENTYTHDGISITLVGTSGGGYQYNNSKYLILGKQNATLTFSAFSWKTTKIVVTGRSGASTNAKQNIFVGSSAVSTETTGATGTNTYAIASASQAAGTIYTLKVTSSHNTQITKIEIYGEKEESTDPGSEKTDVTDEQLAWSAEEAEVTIGDEPYSFPSLTNTLPLEVTYQSTNTAVATIDANGDITLVKAGSTTIKAIYAGSETLNAKTVSYELTVNPAPLTPIAGGVIDELTITDLGVTSNSYTQFTNKQASNDNHSEAKYSGYVAKNSGGACIQITSESSNSVRQIASTTSGGTVKRVQVIWATGTSNTNGRFLTVYGNNTGYTGTARISGETSLGTLTYHTGDASAYIDIDGSYTYMVIVASGAMYMDQINITWLPAAKHELTFGVAASGHGSLAASVGGNAINSGAQVAEGATVTLTPTADTYYQFSAVSVLDGNADEVTTTENDGVYTFAMPTSDAIAEVSFAYIPVTGLTLNKTELEMLVGGASETLSVTAVEPANAYAGVIWSSENTNIATVNSETGVVTAVAASEDPVNIIATSVVSGAVTATCAVTVSAPTGHEINITSANGTVVATSGDDVIEVADVLKDVAVVLTATPNAGYTISGWTVVGLDEGDYSISQDKTTCSFTMPDDEVLVEVTYTHEAAVLKLHDAAGVTEFAGNHFWKEEVTLPTSAAPCSKTFMGWSTDPDCATAPELGATYVLPNKGENHIYAVYATVTEGDISYVKLANQSFDPNAKYIIAAAQSSTVSTLWYFNSCDATDANNGWGKMTTTPATNAPIELALSGTASALKIREVSGAKRYLEGLSTGNFKMSASEKILTLGTNGEIKNSASTYTLRHNYNSGNGGLRWYSNTTGTIAYLYKVEAAQIISGYTTVCQPQAATPTFSVDEGTYYVGQSVELACTTEGATIYYTIDGSAPSTSSTKYTAAISLSERAITTIKAIAVAEGFDNSEVAEAQYNINLPYDFADFAALTKENGKEYVVRGIISQKDAFNEQYKEIPYYISANGSTEGQIKCHNGLGLNKAPFTSADDINLGDNVTVVGTWSEQYNNIGAANWMLEYTARAHDSYEIVGDLTTTGFQVGEAFDDAILANLSVKEVFTNGYEEAVAGATFNCGDKTEWLENETTLTVYAKLGDDDLTSKNFGVTVSSATLVSFVLKEGYKTEYYVGDEFVKPTVIATLSDNTHPEAEATACTGYNMSEAGNYTVNVSYTYGDITISEGVEYQITVKKVFDNEDDPHTVAVAKVLIEPYTTTSTEYMWVRGIVSQVGSISSGKLKYYISDNGSTEGQLYVYDGKYLDNASFTNDNILQVNDEVVIKGKAQNYQSNTLELTSSQVISLAREVEVTVANVAELEVGQADLAVEDLTITTLSEGAVTLVSGDETKATIINNKIHAVAAGDVTITANVAANGIYKAASAEFTVHVVATKPRFAVTFSTGEAGENVSGAAPEAIDNQLENAEVTLPACTWTWAGHKFTGWAVTAAGELVDVENNQFNMPAANVTITAQWQEVLTAKISFMVGGEAKASIDKEQEVAFTIEQDGAAWAPTGFSFVGWATDEQAEETAVAPETITEYTPQAGIAEVSLYGIYSRHDDSDPNYGKYEKATAVVDGDYLIVNETASAAFDGSLTTLDAVSNKVVVTIANGVIANSEAIDNAVFTIDLTAGTLKSHSGNYIGVSSNSNGLKQTTDAKTYTNTFSVDGDGNAVIKANFDGSTIYLRFNKANNQDRFRYYNNAGQEAIQLYKKNTGTMWYTSSPAEKVAITFNANGGEGGCPKAIINKGTQLTICAEAPTKSHSEFAGWKNGDDEYVAGQAYTFDADITLTAQWNDAATYTVTFDKNGGTGDAETMEDQYEGDAITLPAALTKDDYTFQGWKYDDKLYKAGASFTMVAADIEFVAQFRKTSVPTNKMSLITDASALVNGMQVTLGCSYVKDEVSYFAMAGDLGSNKYMASITDDVSLADNIATYPNTVVVLTLEQVEGGWNITKDGANYLTLSNTSDLKWDTKDNATAWAISFEAGNVKIAIGNYWIQYNSGSPRFKLYNSNQKQIQLFGQAIVVTEDVNISDLGYTEGEPIVASGANVTLTIDVPTTAPSITAKNGATVVIDQATTAENVVVEDGSKIVANAETTTPTVYFATTMGATDSNGDFSGSASELGSVTNITLADGGEIIYDLTLGTSLAGVQADPNQWHAFSLPFPVSATSGIYNAATGAKLTNGVDYAIMDYHGDIRANGQYGWKKYAGVLQPGVFYIMTVNGDVQTFRFKASVTGQMSQTNIMSAQAYDGSGADTDKGWNGFGNPRWISGQFAHKVQYLDPYTYEYVAIAKGNTIPVGLPFFYKADDTEDVSMDEVGTIYAAPARSKAYEIKDVAVRFGNEVSKDKLYISASEDALNTYEHDKDLVKMFMSQTPKVARISGNAYGMKLCAVNAPMANDQATYSLTLYAPNAGEYTISVPEMENADLYLTYNGSIIWNLSMSEYTNDFAQGNNEGYGLILVKKAPQVTTGVDNAEANEAGVQKVIINEHVYILRDQQMYDVTGKMVK